MEDVRQEVRSQGNVGAKLTALEAKLSALEGSVVSAGAQPCHVALLLITDNSTRRHAIRRCNKRPTSAAAAVAVLTALRLHPVSACR